MEDSTSAVIGPPIKLKVTFPREEPASAKLGADDQGGKVVLMGPRVTRYRWINSKGWGR